MQNVAALLQKSHIFDSQLWYNKNRRYVCSAPLATSSKQHSGEYPNDHKSDDQEGGDAFQIRNSEKESCSGQENRCKDGDKNCENRNQNRQSLYCEEACCEKTGCQKSSRQTRSEKAGSKTCRKKICCKTGCKEAGCCEKACGQKTCCKKE